MPTLFDEKHRVWALRGSGATYALVGYFAYLETVLEPITPFLRAEHGYSSSISAAYSASSLA